ncbi:hypothetical protein AAFF_G00274760 [Aldrovandia affinis]|uniref:Uncharacterized protein n=1 Tax=Aldrovandia affinis TaxID=143900 RepID=A0AAD7SRR9_9TELE|nr:hypothetical protein AAFF_G00274760 [Aldrovandia affinis]
MAYQERMILGWDEMSQSARVCLFHRRNRGLASEASATVKPDLSIALAAPRLLRELLTGTEPIRALDKPRGEERSVAITRSQPGSERLTASGRQKELPETAPLITVTETERGFHFISSPNA